VPDPKETGRRLVFPLTRPRPRSNRIHTPPAARHANERVTSASRLRSLAPAVKAAGRAAAIALTALYLSAAPLRGAPNIDDPTLILDKSVLGDETLVESGRTFTFLIAYTCSSILFDCLDAAIEDVLPPELEIVSVVPTTHVATVAIDGGTNTVTFDMVDPMPAGSTGILRINVRFPPGTLPGIVVSNSADFTASNADSTTSNEVEVESDGDFDMQPAKSLAGDAVVGFPVDFVLQVCDDLQYGGIAMLSPTFTDTLPVEAEFVTAQGVEGVDWTYDPLDHSVTFINLPTVPASGCISRTVTVIYDSLPGNLQTNTLDVSGTPEGCTDPLDLPAYCDGQTERGLGPVGTDFSVIEPFADGSFGKSADSDSTFVEPAPGSGDVSSYGVQILAGEAVEFSLQASNTGYITLTDAVVIDTLPAEIVLDSWTVEPASGALPGTVDGFYQRSDVPGVWQPLPGNPYAAPTLISTASLGLPPGVTVTHLRWDLGDLPPQAGAWSSTITATSLGSLTVGTVFANCSTFEADYVEGGVPGSTFFDPCADVEVVEPRAIPRSQKTNDTGPHLPGASIDFTISTRNEPEAHLPIEDITVADLLPAELEYAPGSFTFVSGPPGAPAPNLEVINPYAATGRTLLRWDWTDKSGGGGSDARYTLQPGEELVVSYTAVIVEQTPPDRYLNKAVLIDFDTPGATLDCNGSMLATDVDDLDDDGLTSETSCQNSDAQGFTDVSVFLQADSEKFVKGALDADFSKLGLTYPGGDSDWKLVITNTSNITLTNLTIIDILPFVGDTGVIVSTSRGSEWRPNFQGPVVNTFGVPLTVFYSTASNPCRPEVLPSGPPGCEPPMWSTTLPPDPTSVQSLKLDFCSRDPGGAIIECHEVPVNGTIELEWPMVAPNDAPTHPACLNDPFDPQDPANADCQIAWNSFGFAASGGGLEMLPAEPIRVGIRVFDSEAALGDLGDFVFLDVHGQQDDGIQQPEEPGINGVRVELYRSDGTPVDLDGDGLVDFRVTGPNHLGEPGYYLFPDLPPDDYILRFYPPASYTVSPPDQGGDDGLDSDGTTPGVDPTYGPYIETDPFPFGSSDDLSRDQGMWPETDYGDAPAGYPVEAASQVNPADAARHIMVPGIQLGDSVDAELDGQPHPDAHGDDVAAAPDDEDGVVFNDFIGTTAEPIGVLTIGQTNGATVDASVSAVIEGLPVTYGFLTAWVDFDRDGTWDGAGEQVAVDRAVSGPGDSVVLSFTVPAGAEPGATYMRFRLSTEPGLTPYATAPDGEVEDYKVFLIRPPAKSIAASSAAHTSPDSVLTIGEVATYRLVVALPEGELTDFRVVDALPAGLSYVDGSARLALVSNTGITSTNAAINPAQVVGDGTTVASTVPSFPLPPGTVLGAPFSSGTDPTFDLSTLSNPDDDGFSTPTSDDEEFVVIEFDAVVLNIASNQAGAVRNNRFTVSFGSSAFASNIARADLEEPVLAIAKDLQRPTPFPLAAGVAVDYVVVIEHAGSSTLDAFDVVFTDTLPADLTNPSIVGVSAIGVAPPTAGVSGNTVRMPASGTFDLPLGASVTITYSAEIAAPYEPGRAIDNVAGAVWTTLPGPDSEERGDGNTPSEPDGEDLLDGGALDDYEVQDSERFNLIDMGDLPDPAYTTLLASAGAAHYLDGVTYLGASVDSELDGTPAIGADGDDLAGAPDDEDGIAFLTPMMPGQGATIEVTAGSAGFLNGFIDFGGDGVLDPVTVLAASPGVIVPGSNLLSDVQFTAGGTYEITIAVPPAPVAASLYSRFRFTAGPGEALTPDGFAPTGEVEDYVLLSLGDTLFRDDGTGGGVAADGARQAGEPGLPGVLVELYPAGAAPLVDPPIASVVTDAGGNYLFTGLAPGNYVLHVPPSQFQPAGPLEGLVSSPGAGTPDADTDDDADENGIDDPQPAANGITTGAQTLSLAGEPTAEDGDPNSNLTLDLGFVEIDLGDLPDSPYPTLVAGNGARHIIDGVTFLGGLVDGEPDGAPSIGADGDDLAGAPDDEDGIVFLTPVMPGQQADILVLAASPGFLNGFIDFDGDGVLDSVTVLAASPGVIVPGSNLLSDVQIPAPGAHNLTIAVPSGAIATSLYSRFRYSAVPGEALTPTGLANSGEVEDYVLLSLGNRLWFDDGSGGGVAADGVQQSGEPGVPGALVQLHSAGADPLVDSPLATTTTSGSGDYLFTGLEPGAYFVHVPPTQFQAGGPLAGWFSSPGAGTPDANLDQGADENGIDDASPFTNGISTGAMTLSRAGEPTAEDGDPNSNLTLDLGFVQQDWGDLPDGPYPTLRANDGPRHTIDGVTFLGASVDGEGDGKPHPGARGDDLIGAPDDEDGVSFLTPLVPGDPAEILVVASAPGYLNAWLDFDGDGVFDLDDRIAADLPLIPGANLLAIPSVPSDATGAVYARFRFTVGPAQANLPTGEAPNGEVEDYILLSLGDRVFLDDGAGGGVADNGAQDGGEAGVPGVRVELYRTGQTPGVDTPIGVDTTDAGGNYEFPGLEPGDYIVHIPAGEFAPGRPLHGRLSSTGAGDPNADVDQDIDENGIDSLDPAATGISTAPVMLTIGGEPTSEDGDDSTNFTIDFGFVLQDFGDLPAPYATTFGDGGASHIIDGVTFLGAGVDDERDGQPETSALGDDATGAPADDEDGVTFLTPLLPGQPATIRVTASVTGYLNAWIDFNVDGAMGPGEQVAADLALAAGVNDIEIPSVPADVGGSIYSRWRLTSQDPGGSVGFGGPAPDGEVEDYVHMELGNLVFLDDGRGGGGAGNGVQDGAEPGVPGVVVQLFRVGEDPLADPPLGQTSTDADGRYTFPGLEPGDYFVFIPPPNFGAGGPLEGLLSSPGEDGADTQIDHDDGENGLDTPNPGVGGVSSGTIGLVRGFEAISEDGDPNTALVLDFGFFLPNASRGKVFYDPSDPDDPYINERADGDLVTLRTYGRTTVCDPLEPGRGNLPNTAGSNAITDTLTGRVPEDPPYTDPEGPFSPLSQEAPEADYVTWNPAWISERLADSGMLEGWGCAGGLDEVSAQSNIRIGGVNGSEKVWLRHWYEPTRLDKDLDANDCLTDADFDGVPDAPLNPDDLGAGADEWYPAIMTELTYVLMENDLPVRDPTPARLDRSAPRPACGPVGRTRFVFPVGTSLAATDPLGPLEGHGLTSLDADFDGRNDMVNVTSEALLAADLGVDIDFDGDNMLDSIDTDGLPLTCDEMVVLHTDALSLEVGGAVQFLDHFVRLRSASDGSAVLEVWYAGDRLPRLVQARSVGVGGVALSGDVGPLQVLPAGGTNLGSVPVGAWFVSLRSTDAVDNVATVVVGRALGAPCASMESAPNATNLSPGGPWFLKRFYVDGVQYNTVALMTCGSEGLQYITLRAPLPKVPVTIEQHSVSLQQFAPLDPLALPPPFNHEHTVLEDVVDLAGDGLEPCPILPLPPVDEVIRPNIHYMGGPIGPVPPVLGGGDPPVYAGRNPDLPVGEYDDYYAMHWFYTEEGPNAAFVGQLREKYGSISTDPLCEAPIDDLQGGFFYNEQILTEARHYTEFFMPDHNDPLPPDEVDGAPACDPDNYYVTTGMIAEASHWRLWTMPDGPVPPTIPPVPPDLTMSAVAFDELDRTDGEPRRVSFTFDPDDGRPLMTSGAGVKLYGGQPDCDRGDCADAASRRQLSRAAGDLRVVEDSSGYPVEVLPYTDPFAPFNPQHPDAPRDGSLTFNPAFMSDARNSGEPLAWLYNQISSRGMNAYEKVYHRIWYEPQYITKIRSGDDCERDLTFPAVQQEYTYLMLDTTTNPAPVAPGVSRMAFPIGTRAEELPLPNPGGALPAGGTFGHGLTTFDGDFDGLPDAVTVHTEATLAGYLDTTWQANRPVPPGPPPPPVPGPLLDLDGDGNIDELDEDCTPLNGNELVVLALEGITLEKSGAAEARSAMLLDYLVVLENVTPAGQAQVRVHFSGGNPHDARPEAVLGVQTLSIGDTLIVDRFQDRVVKVRPGETNPGTDGAWFLFLEDVASGGERATFTLGRALGGAHSAIDDGAGRHDLTPGDPWYLKRFYVDGHEHNVVAVMAQAPLGADPADPAACNTDFAFISIRTPLPKGNFFNPQDSLFQQGYFLDGLPPEMSVLPPFNVDHTIFEDITRMEAGEYNDPNSFGPCTGTVAPAGPLAEIIRSEEPEPRLGTELRETFTISDTITGWRTHQSFTAPTGYTEVGVPEGQTYLLTLPWRAPGSRLTFYGCTRGEPGPFTEDEPPPLSHADLYGIANCWRPEIVPLPDGGVTPFTGQATSGDLGLLPARSDGGGGGGGGADLRLEKAAEVTTPPAGTQVSFSLEVFNDGPDDAPGYVVFDLLPPGLTYASDTAAAVGGSCDSGTPPLVLCTFGFLAADDSEVFEITADIDPGIPPGTLLENFGTVVLTGDGGFAATGAAPGPWAHGVSGATARLEAAAALSADPNPDNDEGAAAIIVTGLVDLSLTGEAAPDPVVAGERLTRTLRVTNDGPSDAHDVRLTDSLSAGTRFVSAQGAACGGVMPGDGGVLRCALGPLRVGETAEVVVVVGVDSGVSPGVTIESGATVEAIGASEAMPADNSDGEGASTIAEADLAVARSGPAAATPGEAFEWWVTVTNAGPSDARGAFVVHELPAGVRFESSRGAECTPDGVGRLLCSVGEIPSGEAAEVWIRAVVEENTRDGVSLDGSTTAGSATTERNPANNTAAPDPERVVVSRTADLSLTKEALDPAVAGGQQRFRLTVFNAGPSGATEVEIADALPPGMALAYDHSACNESAGEIVCSLPEIAAGGSRSLDLTAAIADDLESGTILRNTARVRSSGDDPVADNDSAAIDVAVERRANLRTGIAAPAEGIAGGGLIALVRVLNEGPSAARPVTLDVQLPSGLTPTELPMGCVSVAGGVRCAMGEIAASEEVVARLALMLSADAEPGSRLRLAGMATSPTADPDETDNAIAAWLSVGTSADLRLSLTSPAELPLAGESHMLSLEVRNAGPSVARGVVLETVSSPGVQLEPAAGSGSAADGCAQSIAHGIRCALGSIAAGATVSLELEAKLAGDLGEGASIEYSSEARSAETDPNPSAARASLTMGVAARSDLSLELIGPDEVEPGASIEYQVRVANLGPSRARDAGVAIELPAGVVLDAAAAAATGCTVGDDGLICPVGDVHVADTATFAVPAQVAESIDAGILLTASALVRSGTADENATNNAADTAASVVLRDEANLALSMRSLDERPAAGGLLTYLIGVRNAGPRSAPDTQVRVVLPTGVTFDRSQPSACSAVEGGALECDLGNLPAGSSVEIEIVVRLDRGLGDGAELLNTATVSSTRSDPDSADNSALAAAEVVRRSDLSAVLETDPAVAMAGEVLRYVGRISNAGPSDAGAARAVFEMPPDSALVGHSGACDARAWPRLDCDLGRLAAGTSTRITVDVDIEPSATGGTALAKLSALAAAGDDSPENDVDTSLLDVRGRSDLVLEKRVSESMRVPGAPQRYELRVANDGPATARRVVLEDRLPEGVTYSADSAGCDLSELPLVRCALGRIDPGQAVLVAIDVEVDAGIEVGGTGRTIVNTARVASAQADPAPANNESTASFDVVSEIDLVLSADGEGEVIATGGGAPMRLLPGAVSAGRRMTVSLAIDNRGKSGASGVNLGAAIPPGLVFSSASGGICEAADDGRLECALPDVDAGGTSVLTLSFVSDPGIADGTRLGIEAEVTADEPEAEGRSSDNSAGYGVTVGTAANLALELESPATVVLAGGSLALEARVTSNGPSLARAVEVTATLPAGVALDGAPHGCTPWSGGLVCRLDDLAPGADAVVRIPVRVENTAAEGMRELLVQTASAAVDPDPTDNAARTGFAVSPAVDLSLGLSAAGEVLVEREVPVTEIVAGEVTAGRELHVELRTRNAGPSPASDAVVTLDLPAGVSLAPGTADCSAAGASSVVCSLGDLAVGADSKLLLRLRTATSLPSGTLLELEGSLSARQLDVNSENNSDRVVATVLTQADVAVVAIPWPGTIEAGGELLVIATAANAGPSSAAATRLHLEVPDMFVLLEAPDSCAPEPDTRDFLCGLGALPPGATGELRFKLRAKPGHAGRFPAVRLAVGTDAQDLFPTNDTAAPVVNVAESGEPVPPAPAPPTPVPPTASPTLTPTPTATPSPPASPTPSPEPGEPTPPTTPTPPVVTAPPKGDSHDNIYLPHASAAR